MSVYLVVKLVHILGATILFGTGLGIAFFMYQAFRSNDAAAIRHTARQVVRADWLFTAPAVVVQLLTGLWLTNALAIPHGSAWFMTVITLFVVVGMCWLPVVCIQIRIQRVINDVGSPEACRRLFRWWIALGIPAFSGVIALFVLMVFRPGTHWIWWP